MQWLTVAWWRWRVAQVLGRNPLVRRTDRIEVIVMVLAVAVSLAVVPFAGAIGTAVHDGQSRVYTAERQSRHKVETTSTENDASTPKGPVAAVTPRWQPGDVETAGAITWDTPAKTGSKIDVWVDQSGHRVSAPPPQWQAGVDAVTAAIGFWLAVSAVTALLVALVRGGLTRARNAGWNRDIASLVHDDGGRTNRRW